MQATLLDRRHGYGDRVREHTAPAVNRAIDQRTAASIDACVRSGREAIVRRLGELEEEWDIDRAMFVNFAVLGGVAFATGLKRYVDKPLFLPRRKGFLYFFGAQLGFLFLHGVAGWCPPVSLFRRLGFRTMREIELERATLLRALETEPTTTSGSA